MSHKRIGRRTLKFTTVLAVAGLIAGLIAVPVAAGVTPPSVDITLKPGESFTVTKTVGVPEATPRLDLYLIVDLSGSYSDDIAKIKTLAPSIVTGVRASVSDSNFGLGSFVDFPFSPWGAASTGDYGYRRDQDLTATTADWVAAVNAMAIKFGGDGPESQYEALFQAATGAGREMPPTTDCDYLDLGEIAPGQNASFRADATKVIALTTDADFHNPGDPGSAFAYPGPSRTDTVNALVSRGIKVIAIKAPGATTDMDDIATATGGAVVTTGSSSDEIVTAILSGLAAIKFDVTAVPVGCAPLNITFNPTKHTGVSGGTSVQFEETIAVPASVTADAVVSCTVEFRANDAVIGRQTVRVRIDVLCGTVLDNFNRPDGRLGPNWRGSDGGLGGYFVRDERLDVERGGPIYWRNEIFGPNQDACITLEEIDPHGQHHSVLLKVQGNSWRRGAIAVFYETITGPTPTVGIETYVPRRGWETLAALPMTLANGDQLGGRAEADGTVRAYVNGVEVLQVKADEFADKGGRVGMWFFVTADSILDDFAGGNFK